MERTMKRMMVKMERYRGVKFKVFLFGVFCIQHSLTVIHFFQDDEGEDD